MPHPGFTRRDTFRLGGVAALGAAAAPSLAACSSGPQLEYMFWGSSAEQDAITAMLENFADGSEGLVIRPQYTPGDDYDTKMNALVASGNVPDVAYMNTMGYRLGEQGHLVNLAEHFEEYPGLSQRLPGSYFWWDEDKCYGTQGANETMLMFYNRAAFADAGVEVPPAEAGAAWDWETYVETAYRLTADADGRRPDESGFDPANVARFGTLAGMWSGNWYGLLLSAGVDVVDESGTQTQINSPEAVRVFQGLVDLMYEHRVAPSPTQLGNNAPANSVQLASDRLAMVIDGQWALLDMSTADFDYGIGVLPHHGTPMTTTMGGATAIFSDTEFLDEALSLYEFQSDPQQVELFRNGLWMPLEERYYTDPEWTSRWLNPDVHPPEYQTAAIDYTLNNSKVYFPQKLRNSEAVDRLITPAIERIQTGEEDVQTVLDELADQLQDGVLQGVYPSPAL